MVTAGEYIPELRPERRALAWGTARGERSVGYDGSARDSAKVSRRRDSARGSDRMDRRRQTADVPDEAFFARRE